MQHSLQAEEEAEAELQEEVLSTFLILRISGF